MCLLLSVHTLQGHWNRLTSSIIYYLPNYKLKTTMLRSLLSFAKGGNGNGNSYIFPTVDPKDDGPDCKRDCADCTVNYPSKLKIETSIPLYGHLKPFDMHILVATGKSDWTQKPTNEKGSLPEALSSAPTKSNHGVCSFILLPDLASPGFPFDIFFLGDRRSRY